MKEARKKSRLKLKHKTRKKEENARKAKTKETKEQREKRKKWRDREKRRGKKKNTRSVLTITDGEGEKKFNKVIGREGKKKRE